MKICTINLPQQYIDAIKVLTDIGYFPNRSEAIRQALAQFLVKEVKMIEGIRVENFRELKENQMNALIGSK